MPDPAATVEHRCAATHDDPLELLDAGQVADLFGLNQDVVYRLAGDGLLPSIRLGRRLRFPRRQLDELITSGGRP